jgi:transposase
MPSNKPPVVQAAVIAKSMNGDSKRQIAEDLGLGRNTVTAILEDAERNQLVLQGRDGIYQLIGKSVQALERAIDKGKTTEEAQLILRATGVLPQEQSENNNFSATVNLGVFPDR